MTNLIGGLDGYRVKMDNRGMTVTPLGRRKLSSKRGNAASTRNSKKLAKH